MVFGLRPEGRGFKHRQLETTFDTGWLQNYTKSLEKPFQAGKERLHIT